MPLIKFIIIIATLATPLVAEGIIEFNKDIRPIFSDHCFSCHGPDKRARKADLRLDTYEGAIRDLGGYSAIVPGDPDKSELLLRTMHSDPEELMPPPKSKIPKLDSEKIRLLTQWIKEGANYQRHWSFSPIANPIRNNKEHLIDYFISKRLKKEEMVLSERADPYTLIRRLYLDLTGLLLSLIHI